ncbi:MAG: hypothetical protein ACRCZ9_08295 [Fusobacteriaceae bacterium]
MYQIHYDYKSPNGSFINTYLLLKNLGLTNNKFMLMVLDPGLIGVDPRDPNLTSDMMQRVAREVQMNPWYYLREVVRIPTDAGNIPFMLHIGSCSAAFLALQGFNYYHEQPRQTGKTVLDAALNGWQFAFGAQNADFGFFNYDAIKTADNIGKVLDILELNPDYLKVHSLKKKVDKDGNMMFKDVPESAKRIMSVENEIMSNVIIGKTPGTTPRQADTAGRGATMRYQNWDEIGYINNNWIAFGSAIYAFMTAAEAARSIGATARVSLTSTPPDMAKKEGEWLYNFVFNEMARWDVMMFDWSEEQLITYLRKNAAKDFWYVTFHYYELGYTEEWATKRARGSATPKDYRKDILLMWEKATEGCPFDNITLDKIRKVVENEKVEVLHMDNLYTFKLLQGFYKSRFKRVSIGVDVAGGLGGERDSSTMVGVDPETCEVLFTFKNNVIDTNEFSTVIYKFVRAYCPNALVVIERNSYGKSICDNLKRTDIQNNLYYTKVSASSMLKGIVTDLSSNGNGYQYGVFNQSEIRAQLTTSILPKFVKEHKNLIRSYDIYDEITSLVEKNNRIEHRGGCHDDLIMAWLFALYALLYDNDLSDNFNIPRPVPVSDQSSIDEGMGVEVHKDIVSMMSGDKKNIDLGELVKAKQHMYGEQNKVKKFTNDTVGDLMRQVNMAVATHGVTGEDAYQGDTGTKEVGINFANFYGMGKGR